MIMASQRAGVFFAMPCVFFTPKIKRPQLSLSPAAASLVNVPLDVHPTLDSQVYIIYNIYI